MRLGDITRKLNQEEISTKSMIKLEILGETRNKSLEAKNIWTYSEVYRLIQDQQYLGKFVYGKTSKVSVSKRTQVAQPEKDWIVAENTHEPLVSQEVFDTIQELLPRKGKYNRGKRNNLYTGRIKCGVCNHALPRSNTAEPHYRRAYSNHDINSKCMKGAIYEEPLTEIILDSLIELIKSYVSIEEVKLKCNKKIPKKIYFYIKKH